MKPRIAEIVVERFIAELSQPKWCNRWGTPEAVRAALEFALDPNRVGLDRKYECDAIGCKARVDVAGDRCELHEIPYAG